MAKFANMRALECMLVFLHTRLFKVFVFEFEAEVGTFHHHTVFADFPICDAEGLLDRRPDVPMIEFELELQAIETGRVIPQNAMFVLDPPGLQYDVYAHPVDGLTCREILIECQMSMFELTNHEFCNVTLLLLSWCFQIHLSSPCASQTTCAFAHALTRFLHVGLIGSFCVVHLETFDN